MNGAIFGHMNWLKISGASGFLAVACGAFGAHALRDKLPPELLSAWQTGVLYHLVHSVALFALALFAKRPQGAPDVRFGAWAFLAGILLFSGSLYALSLTGARVLGAVTPFGGVAFLAGWAWVAWKLAPRA